MPARPQPPSQDRPVNNLGRGDQGAIQNYLAVTDDGEIARIAAMMTPKGDVFDERAQVAQATALQAEAAAELVRRREAIASSMNHATLIDLAGRLDIEIDEFLPMMDEDGFTDPITGPVLRRLAELMRAMPPPQDYQDQFLADDPTAALELASSRTTLPRPLPDATFEEALRYAANIPTDEVSWDILNGAFCDFFRIWCLYPALPMDLFPADAGAVLTKAKFSKLLANLKRHQQELASFHDTFTPGKEFLPEIDELAHRAYAECWEGGLAGPLWRRRLAWLVVEFTPFWHRHGAAYRVIHQARVKVAADAEAARAKAAAEVEAELRRDQNKKSAKARESGRIALQNREAKRFRKITADFIGFLKASPKDSEELALSSCAATFAKKSPSLGKTIDRKSAHEFLSILSAAVTEGKDAICALRAFQRPLEAETTSTAYEKFLSEMTPSQREEFKTKDIVPYSLLRHKKVTEEAVRDCLEDLKHALPKARVKKLKK